MREGWFADLSDPEDRVEGAEWQAFLQVAGGCHALNGIWFSSREECDRFIRRSLAGQLPLDDTPDH